ncbi:hypothetical protein EON81_14260 [bacterium]|nr:MAG: hypothetical protein EON81_14260 [bacterium]
MRNGAASTLSILSLALLACGASAQNAAWRLGDVSPATLPNSSVIPDTGGYVIPERLTSGEWFFPVFDLQTGKQDRTLSLRSTSGRPLSMSDDGQTFAQRADTNGQHLIQVWKDGDEAPFVTFEEPELQGEPQLSGEGNYVLATVGTGNAQTTRWYSLNGRRLVGERPGKGVFVKDTNYLIYGSLAGIGMRGIANLATGGEETAIRDKWTAGPFVPHGASGSHALVQTAGSTFGGVLRTFDIGTGKVGNGADIEGEVVAAHFSSDTNRMLVVQRFNNPGRFIAEYRDFATFMPTPVLKAYSPQTRLLTVGSLGVIVPSWTGSNGQETLRSVYALETESGEKVRLQARETLGFVPSQIGTGQMWQIDRTGRFVLVNIATGSKRRSIDSGFDRIDEVSWKPEGGDVAFKADGLPSFKVRPLDLDASYQRSIAGVGGPNEHIVGLGQDSGLLTHSPSARNGRFYWNFYYGFYSGPGVSQRLEEWEGGTNPVRHYGDGIAFLGSDVDGGIMKAINMYNNGGEYVRRRIRLGEKPTHFATAPGYVAVSTASRIRVYRTSDWTGVYSRAAIDTRGLALSRNGRYLAVLPREGETSNVIDVQTKSNAMDLTDLEGLNSLQFLRNTSHIIGVGPVSRAFPFLAVQQP